MQLTRLIYYSTNNIRSREQALASDLKLLLSNSIRNNREHGITGGLVFNRTNFLQVLEGDEPEVTLIFSRILRDSRHTNVVNVEVKAVTERSFGEWSMGYAGRTAAIDGLCERLGVNGKLDPARMSADNLGAFVLELVSTEEKIASTALERPYVD